MGKLLDKIHEPKDLKALDTDQLLILAKEIRKYLIEVVSESGGHLSSNLGVVELTIALHYCFNSPRDKIIWDVGHQSYVHKILTGRKEALKTIRKYNGLSGFPKTEESKHDVYNTGHSSTSISAALGFASARDLLNEKNYIIPIIGDGALTGGLAFEALNNASNLKSNFIVILNDNQMSISENVGGISLYLDSIRTADFYNDVKEDVQRVLRKIPKYGEGVINKVRDVKDSVKQLFIPGMFFEEMGFKYLGPIDGHNVKKVITVLNQAKKVDGPILIHINTTKGKGYKYAEAFPSKFHGIKPFEKESGDIIKDNINGKSFSQVFGDTLVNIAKDNEKVIAITAAMPEGTGLVKFSRKYPKRFFDVGIAEQHAVVFSGGLALSGFKPFVAIYSSFLQRAYDQVLHDICLQKIPVVFAIDRTGLVGEDGETHQGVFDTSFLSHMPNMVIMAPKNTEEFKQMLIYSSNYNDGPISIKYPRGIDKIGNKMDSLPLEFGKAEVINQGNYIAIISVGTMCYEANEVSDKLIAEGFNPTLINARFIKPIDKEKMIYLARSHKIIVVIEENVISGGFGSQVLTILNDNDCNSKLLICGIEDHFVTHGDREMLLDDCDLTPTKIYNKIKNFIKINKQVAN